MKLATLVVFAVLLGSVANALNGARATTQALIEGAEKDLQNSLAAAARRAEAQLAVAEQDLRFLRETPPIQGYLRARANDGVDPVDGSTTALWSKRFNTILRGLLAARSDYASAAYVLADGTVVASQVQVAGAGMSESEARPLRPGTLVALENGVNNTRQVQASSVALEDWHGQETPLLRFALGVERDGAAAGALLVTVNAAEMLRALGTTVATQQTFLVDPTGQYILRAGGGLPFRIGPGESTFAEDMPKAAAFFAEAGSKTLSVAGHMFAFETVNPTRTGSVASRWALVRCVDEAVVLAGVRDFQAVTGVILLGTVILIVMGSLAASAGPLGRVKRLAAAAVKVRDDKDYSIRVGDAGADELRVLSDAFDAMLGTIEANDRALQANAAELAATLDTVERTNAAIRLILDNVEEGLVVAGDGGLLQAERSAAFDRLFPGTLPTDTLAGIFNRAKPGLGDMMQMTVEQSLEGIMPANLVLSQAPTHAQLVSGAHIELSYCGIARATDPEDLDRVLVIAKDVSAEVARKEQEAASSQLLAAFAMHSRDPASFTDAIEEASGLVESAVAGEEDGASTMRDLHTLKGNLGLLGLRPLAALVHDVETRTIEEGEFGAQDRERVRSSWAAFLKQIEMLTGSGFDTVVAPRDQYLAVRKALIAAGDHAAAAIAACWEDDRVAPRVRQLENEAHRLAERDGFELDVITDLEGGTLPRDERWLWSVTPHLVRNAVDHGFGGAPVPGRPAKLTIRTRSTGETFFFEVADNGRGIDWDALRAKAERLGLAGETKADLIEVIFADGVSTREEVSSTSGRGVGMAAVRAQCAEHDASIAVESSREGTTVRIALKLEPAVVRLAS